MPVSIIISNDMWNDKNHSASVSSFDPIEAYVYFDQPISHALEYIEKEITSFWLRLSIEGEVISVITSNKVLPELMDEAKTFKNGKFKFSVSKLPDALTQHYHAAFARKMSEMPEGKYMVNVSFHTDNPLQKDNVLAEEVFEFVLEAGSKDHLVKVAEENVAKGADTIEDVSMKLEKFSNLNKPSEKFSEVMVTFKNNGSEEIWIMAGYNSGKKFSVPYQQSLAIAVPAGTEFFKVENGGCSTNFGTVAGKRKEETIEVY